VTGTRWLEILVRADRAAAGAWEDSLVQLGAQAVTFSDAQDQPILEPNMGETPLWSEVSVKALFDDRADPWLIKAMVDQQALACTDFSHQFIADEDWTRAWMRDFKPLRFGRRLWIVPSHCEPPQDAAVSVTLDPGLAFGTGTHATTALCLEWLDQLDLEGKTVLDFGCGSGVLAIAALKLGAARAFCVDHDPQAIQATRDNSARNGLAERIEIATPDRLPQPCADVVVANILAGPLIDLAPSLAAWAKPDAQLGLSGVLLDQGRAVRRAYEGLFDQIEIWQQSDWLLIKANKI